MKTETAYCPHCRRAVPGNAPSGLCRHCLLNALLDGETESASDNASPELQAFGDYDLLEIVGRGGMGVVYRARQRRLNRIVALKRIRTGEFASEDERKRFQAEAEAAAQLDHPNIVPIFEVGECDGQDYFSMKWVESGSLARNRDRVSDPARFVSKLARAVHYAHQRGILHRDLKPANILIDDRGEPLLSDFGLAKRVGGSSDMTLSGAVLGSPNYLSPEQAAGSSKDVTTAVDIYGLGAVFYELLTGLPPFQADTPLATMRAVLDEEPKRPGAIQAQVDRDLETICLKCLEKDPRRRYATAAELADDLDRWLRHEPIRARPSGPWETLLKWVRRRPAWAALIGFSLIAVFVFAFLLIENRASLKRERDAAVKQEQIAENQAAIKRQNLYATDLYIAQRALDDGNLDLACRLVDAQRPNGSDPDLRGFEWRHLAMRCRGDALTTLSGHSSGLYCVGFSSDGQLLASGDDAGFLILWATSTWKPIETLKTGSKRLVRVGFSSDALHLITADDDGLVKIWNRSSRQVVWSRTGRNPQGVSFASHHDWVGISLGSTAHTSTNATALVVDWRNGRELLRIGPVADFEAFSADGTKAFITSPRPPRTEVWDIASGRLVQTYSNIANWIVPSSNGRTLASLANSGNEIGLMDVAEGKVTGWIRWKGSSVWNIAFSPDGSRLVGAGVDQSVRCWELPSMREATPFLGHVDSVTAVAYSPDGRQLVTGGLDKTLRIWPPQRAEDFESITNAHLPHLLSPDATKLACFDRSDGPSVLLLHDFIHHTTTPLTQPGEPVRPEFFSSDSKTLYARGALVGGRLPLRSWDMNALSDPPHVAWISLAGTNAVYQAAANPDGTIYALWQPGTPGISLWNPRTGESIGTLTGSPEFNESYPLRFSPDGRKLASMASPNRLHITPLDQPGSSLGKTFPVGRVNDVVFSRDGHTLALACEDHVIRLLDARTLEEIGTLRGHQQSVSSVAFSSDGRTLASCGYGGSIKLWCLPARREVATLQQGAQDLTFIAFGPEDRTLMAGGWADPVHIFRVPTLAEMDAGK